MSNASISLETVKKSLMEDDQFKTEYDKLKPRYDAIAQIIKARQELRITQAELAQRKIQYSPGGHTVFSVCYGA